MHLGTRTRTLPWLVVGLLISITPAASAQVCTQPVYLRAGVCPSGATTCTTVGSSLSWAQVDDNAINVANICNGLASGIGTVTSVGCGEGLACSPSPIVGAGTASLGYTSTLSTSLTAGTCTFAANTLSGIVCAGTSGGFNDLLTFTTPTANRTLTFPNVTG